MKIIGINGSPRKSRNTAILLEHGLSAAAEAGADTELIHLYDHDYKGCQSCFACKLIGGKSYGKCIVNDGLKPILEKINEADAILMGSPIYYGNITGEARSFMERLLFQSMLYDKGYSSLIKKEKKTGWIFTMNVDSERMEAAGYKAAMGLIEGPFRRVFGSAESLFVNDTYQFDDYSKYETSAWDEKAKAERRELIFPEDCRKAYELGKRLVTE